VVKDIFYDIIMKVNRLSTALKYNLPESRLKEITILSLEEYCLNGKLRCVKYLCEKLGAVPTERCMIVAKEYKQYDIVNYLQKLKIQ
jgi:hypothetical protein